MRYISQSPDNDIAMWRCAIVTAVDEADLFSPLPTGLLSISFEIRIVFLLATRLVDLEMIGTRLLLIPVVFLNALQAFHLFRATVRLHLGRISVVGGGRRHGVLVFDVLWTRKVGWLL
jgi:hypothetical protein